MAYGSLINSDTDGSMLLSTDAYAQVHTLSDYPFAATPDNLTSYFLYYAISTNPSKRPIFFLEIDSYLLKPLNVFWDSTNEFWVLRAVYNRYSLTALTQCPKVHVFEDIRDISYTSSGWGMELFDADGDLTYSTDVGDKILRIQAVGTLNYNCNFGVIAHTTLPITITRPALAYHTAFFGLDHLSGSSGSYLLSHVISGLLLNTSTDIACATFDFMAFSATTDRNNYVVFSDTRYAQTAFISAADYD